MSSIDMEILNVLTDEDIKILCKNGDLNMMITPIKQNAKTYSKYMAQLGRIDKKSILVQKNLPRIAFELYKKGDVNYLKFFAMTATNIKMIFEKMLHEFLGENIKIQEVQDFSIEDYKRLFIEILKSEDSSMDLDLFCLQTRLNGIAISDEMKSKINNEWKHLQELYNVRKEIINIQKKEMKNKEHNLHEEMICQKDKFENQIMEFKSEVEFFKADVNSKQKTIVLLMGENEGLRNEIKSQQIVIKSKENEIEGLRQELEEAQSDIDDINKKLHTKTKDIYSEVNTLWKEENEEKLNKSKELEYKITQYMDNLRELESKNGQLKSRIEKWDGFIDDYFVKMDQKIIEHRIDSLLYQRFYDSSEEVATITENSLQLGNLYIQKGYKVNEAEECLDYEDYIEVVETNLNSVGVKMSAGTINDCFNAAIDAGLHPLICGFGARQVALALTAARYAEKSEIISIPVGFNNTQELAGMILNTQTESTIVEDAFGTMNENMLLPILRDTNNGKIIVLTAESTENLKYLQKYFYNYIQLIVIDDYVSGNAHNFVYSNANKLFSESVYYGKEQGHKLARQIFEYIGMSNAYVLTRGNILCKLLAENKNNLQDDALKKLFVTELKWIIIEEQRGKLEELLLSNEDKFSRKLVEYVGQ